MRFSFWTGNGQTWQDTLEGCRYAESTGWDGIWYADHFMPNEETLINQFMRLGRFWLPSLQVSRESE